MAKLNLISLLFIISSTYLYQPTNCLLRSLVPEERYIINWEIIGDEIEFELIVQTTGFIGFGISWNGAMLDADIITVGVDPEGEAYLHDRHGVGEVLPEMDEKQDYHLISATENGTHTIAKFSRLIDTCDKNDLPITGDTSRVIWSIGATDEIKYHGRANRGVISTNFFEGVPEMPDLTPYKVWTTVSNKTMPKKDTTYWVTFHKSPSLPKKHHIYGFDVYLENPDAKAHTHHIDMFRCTPPDGVDADELFGPYAASEGFDLDKTTDGEYFPIEYCNLLAFSWSIGALISMFPDHVGIPLGVIEKEYYLAITHYDNPGELEDVQFECGLSFYYSETLREYDGGFISIGYGYDYTMVIPPYAKDFKIHGQCDSECTRIMPHDVKLVSVLMHAHLAGRKMRLRHWRDGKELPWIASDDHYDFNYQQNLKLDEVDLKQGDHLAVECTYDTTWREGNVTLGGESTREEMCMTFIVYYPVFENGYGCGSDFNKDDFLNYFGITKVFDDKIGDPIILEPVEYNGTRWSKYLEGLDWNDEKRAAYQNFILEEAQNGRCRGIPLLNTTYPAIDKEYKPKDACTKLPEFPNDPPNGSTSKTLSFLVIIATFALFYI